MFNGVENNRSRPYITMCSGKRLHILEIPREEVDPNEIALHLAKNCRFNGLIEGWYSTAEHCLLGLQKCPSIELARQFLIHDAGELVTGDLPAPVKWLYPELRDICNNIQEKFTKHFIGTAILDDMIHTIDYRLCATEQLHLRKAPQEDLIAEPYDDVTFQCYPWEVAYAKWLEAFYLYFPEWKI